MLKRIFGLLLVMLSLIGPVMASSPNYVEGRIIVRFKSEAYKQVADGAKGPLTNAAILDQLAKTAVPYSSNMRTFSRDYLLGVVKLPAGVTVEGAVNSFLSSGTSMYAEPDYINKFLAVKLPLTDVPYQPDDPLYDWKWDHEIMQVREGWGYTSDDGSVRYTGSANVRVAVLDSGVAVHHPDLEANMVFDPATGVVDGYDAAGNTVASLTDWDADPNDVNGHGTHVAGIIGAVGNNAEGVAGINWTVQIVPVKVFADDSPDGATTADVIAGMDWIGKQTPKIDIVNMSIGTYGYSQSYADAMADLESKGIIVVAAAGNDRNNNDGYLSAYPASFDLSNIVSVMATDENDDVAAYSNYGASSVDIAACGGYYQGVLSTYTSPGATDSDPWIIDVYETLSGTSMASPQVAGALALFKSMLDGEGKSGMWPQTAIKLMYMTADELDVLSGKCVTGARLNVFKAMQAIAGTITNNTQNIDYDFDQFDHAVAEANVDDELLFSPGFFPAGLTVDKSLTFRSKDPSSPAVIIPDPNNPNDTILTFTDNLAGTGTVFVFSDIGIEKGKQGAVAAGANTDVSFNTCSLRKNSGSNGCAISANGAISIALTGCTIETNTASGNGGGISVNGGILLVTDTLFTGNSARRSGGAIYAADATVSLSGASFTSNTTTLGNSQCGGAAVYCGGATGRLVCELGTTFTGNNSGANGGAIFIEQSSFDVTDTVFTDNTCVTEGGAVFIKESSAVGGTIANTTITGSHATFFGGGISINTSIVELRNLLMTDNNTNWWGGAIYVTDSISAKAEVNIINITFDNNFAFDMGSAIYASIDGRYNNSFVDVINSIFSNNSNYAIYEEQFFSQTLVNNSLFFNNLQGDFVEDGLTLRTGKAQIDLMAGCKNNIGSPLGAFGVSPMYVTGKLGNYYLSNAGAGQLLSYDVFGHIIADAARATSPCYDAGFGDAGDYDIDTRSARTDGVYDSGRADIGFHYTDPDAPLDGSGYLADQFLTINRSPAAGGTVTPGITYLFKPYAHVVIEATSNAGYMFYNWLDPNGIALTQITDKNPDGNYYAFQGDNGNLLYVDNDVDGVPYKMVMQIKASQRLTASFQKATVTLWVSVNTGNGKIYQNDISVPKKEYRIGQVVNLKAVPNESQHKIRWYGTDEDSLLTQTNTVTIQRTADFPDQYVTVDFYQPQTWMVGPQGDSGSDSIIDILTDPSFKDGDIIQLLPGEYTFRENNQPYAYRSTYISGEVVIQGNSANPEAVVIRNSYFEFLEGVGRNTIIRNLTFDHTRYETYGNNGADGATTDNPLADGENGVSVGGYMIVCRSSATGSSSPSNVSSPTITNCRFVGGLLRAAHGGHGGVVDENPGDGGWPGICYGGAISIGDFCKPIFENCEFINLNARGGDGGNAAVNSAGSPGYPGFWGNPTDSTLGRDHTLPHESKLNFAAIEEKEQYAGRGGAMYIGIGAAPVIKDCRFEGCSAASGSSGLETTGSINGNPKQHYRVPSYGGAVFCDAWSQPLFENCEFINNTAHWDWSLANITVNEDAGIDTFLHRDTGLVYQTSGYQSYGGAVYAQRNSTAKFAGCTFEGNSAVVGGAVAGDNVGYANNDPSLSTDIISRDATGQGKFNSMYNDLIKYFIVEDCTFINNLSDVGGAIALAASTDSKYPFYYADSYSGMPTSLSAGYAMLVRSYFTDNTADITIPVDEFGNPLGTDGLPLVTPTLVINVFDREGQGGALSAYSGRTDIADCQFQGNMSSGYGGAVYVSAKSLNESVDPLPEYSGMYLRNSLIAGNYAGIGGGGIQATTYSDPEILNCTIADNAVTVAGGKGGGILTTDSSSISIKNSILYGNICSNGSQIALAETNIGEPSNANISFSLIEPFVAERAYTDTGMAAVRTINSDDADTITVNETTNHFSLSPLVDVSTGAVDIGFTIKLYGLVSNRVYVSDNGCVSFTKPITTFSRYTLNSNIGTPVIAPFHADVDTSRGNTVTYGRGTVKVRDGGVEKTCKAFFVNYEEVGYYSQKQDKLNSFQLVLVERADKGEGNYDIEFNYDKIQWEAGELQGGVGGLGGITARVGFSNGSGIPGTFYELEGSGTAGIFLDNSITALIAQSRDTRDDTSAGRLVFPIKEGKPQISYGLPVYTEGSSTINYNKDMDMWDPAAQNIVADPLWAVEELYYLSAISAGQDADSPCIDAGSGEAKDNNIYRHTTRVDSRLDANTVDMGFHYTLPITKGLYGDFDFNGEIGADESLWAMIDFWLDRCDYPYWCHGRDLNEDGIVNLIDTTTMSAIGSVDIIPPQPVFNEDGLARTVDFTIKDVMRMTWEVKPVSSGSGQGSITMTANAAIDNCIGDIQYYFKCTYTESGAAGGHDRTWSTDRTYTDTGLTVGKQYAYICFARDTHGNETLSSLAVRTYAGDDADAPITDTLALEPTKAKWLIFPQTSSIIAGVAKIRMVAQTATDSSGVQYFFECTSRDINNIINGHNSTWQDSPEYIDTGLVEGQTYTYRVRTRDKSRNLNVGIWSDTASVIADITSLIDSEKPYPMAFIAFADQTYKSSSWGASNTEAWHNITAWAGSLDSSTPIWYQFICDNKSYSSPRIYVSDDGGIFINEPMDSTYRSASISGTQLTWSVFVGFGSNTLDWKVICGDSAGTENAYTAAEQPQKITLGKGIKQMRYENVINWIITVTEYSVTKTYYPSDFVDMSTWLGGTVTLSTTATTTGS